MAACYRCFIVCFICCLCTTLSSSGDVFISIDCGSSAQYKDDNQIPWVGDDKYVQNGESRSVQSSNAFSHVFDTLRVFTARKKNCYHIDSVEPGRVLVRANFFYGNYDGKSSPPTFALHFDGNHWADVETSITESYYYEVAYVTKRDSISVCVAQTQPGQFPFISALAVRSLDSSMYSSVNDTYPLFSRTTVSFGSNSSVRYPDDPFDRIWEVGDYQNGSIPVESDALFSDLIESDDQPPPAVLKNAIVADAPNTSIQLLMGFPSDENQVYINWYFSEVTKLERGQIRSFRIFKDNEPFSDPILPPFENFKKICVSNITASSDTTFALVATDDSTLPPLINAMEIFRIGESQLTDGTHQKDTQGLASLQESFEALQSWSGDPCLPAPYTWDWVQCNDDSVPRVTSLLLGGNDLTGLLPDFSSMDALQEIDLHNNSLRGPIPDFLGALPNLKTLNLANNQFNGTIPSFLTAKEGLNLT